MIHYVVLFFLGGFMTTLVVTLEVNGFGLLSRAALLFPTITLVSYFFLGDSMNGELATSKHALFVLLGTLIAWVPYMLIIYYFSPKIGVHRALLLGITTFIILALLFVAVYKD